MWSRPNTRASSRTPTEPRCSRVECRGRVRGPRRACRRSPARSTLRAAFRSSAGSTPPHRPATPARARWKTRCRDPMQTARDGRARTRLLRVRTAPAPREDADRHTDRRRRTARRCRRKSCGSVRAARPDRAPSAATSSRRSCVRRTASASRAARNRRMPSSRARSVRAWRCPCVRATAERLPTGGRSARRPGRVRRCARRLLESRRDRNAPTHTLRCAVASS